MKFLPLYLVMLLLGGDYADGVEAYRQGRFREAYEAFTAAEQAMGEHATSELLYNRALAALHVGELRAAEISAEKAASRGGREFQELADFLLGNAAFVRCERAEAEAAMAEADPTALTRAIIHARSSIDFWQLAATRADDWPAARRNTERALLKLSELLEKKAEADENRTTQTQPEPQQPPEPDEPTEEVEEDPTLQAEPEALSAEQLQSLLDKLAQMEREKRTLREAWQRLRTEVERDW